MSNPGDELQIEKKIVLVTDICSSSEIMEDLAYSGASRHPIPIHSAT